MAKEPDRTRWVGIRPTDPSENIPVTESAPLTDILVAPSAGNPQFETQTVKRAPAISDLQAIKHNLYLQEYAAGKDCSGEYLLTSSDPPANEIWIINNVTCTNYDSFCDMSFRTLVGATIRQFKVFYGIPSDIWVSWDGQIILRPDEKIQIAWRLGGATDDLKFIIHGYKIGVY